MNDDTGDRARLIEHLLTHPDHKHSSVAGRNFEYYTIGSIMQLHDRLHMTPGKPWAHKDEGDSMIDQKTLDLKVTVESSDPDAALAKIQSLDDRQLFLGVPDRSVWQVRVTSVERADGQPIGAEEAFEEYWAESHTGLREGTDWSNGEKLEALDAFLYGLRYAKEKKA